MSELEGLNALDALAAEAPAPVDTAATPAGGAARVNGEKLAKAGRSIYRGLTSDQKQDLNANEDKISMIHLLCAESQATTRTEGGTKGIPSFRVVGMKLKTEIDLDVPNIPFQKPPHDLKSIPDISTIQYTHVPAGSEFVLTRVEAMYLFTLPQYKLNGYCAYNGQPGAVQLAAKIGENFQKGGLPTPAFKFTDSSAGSIKTSMEAVDVKGATGWELKPEYAEKFADLLVVRTGTRVTDGMPASKERMGTLASLAIYAALTGGNKQG